jgi:hypothetical protein
MSVSEEDMTCHTSWPSIPEIMLLLSGEASVGPINSLKLSTSGCSLRMHESIEEPHLPVPATNVTSSATLKSAMVSPFCMRCLLFA